MNLTEKEKSLLLRALDKASVQVDAEKAAEALINSLRKRGINGHDFLKAQQQASAPAPPRATPPSQYQPQPEPRRQGSKPRIPAWIWVGVGVIVLASLAQGNPIAGIILALMFYHFRWFHLWATAGVALTLIFGFLGLILSGMSHSGAAPKQQTVVQETLEKLNRLTAPQPTPTPAWPKTIEEAREQIKQREEQFNREIDEMFPKTSAPRAELVAPRAELVRPSHMPIAPGQLHRDQPISHHWAELAPSPCFTVLTAPPFEVALQGAQGQAVLPAEFGPVAIRSLRIQPPIA